MEGLGVLVFCLGGLFCSGDVCCCVCGSDQLRVQLQDVNCRGISSILD